MAKAHDIANQVFDAMTGPDQPPATRGEREALRFGLDLLALTADALLRIADACERSAKAAEGMRPAHDSLDAM